MPLITIGLIANEYPSDYFGSGWRIAGVKEFHYGDWLKDLLPLFQKLISERNYEKEKWEREREENRVEELRQKVDLL